MAYCAYITTIKKLKPHSNADRLQIAEIFGNDVIVGLDVKEGQKGIYFPTDGKLGLEFALENKLLRKDKDGNELGGYLEYNTRHIKALKLRGERSDGLFMPIESLSKFTDHTKLNEGDTITTLGKMLICEKYIPNGDRKKNQPAAKGKKTVKKNLYPFFQEHKDTSQLMYNLGKFNEGDTCYITLKLHGTSHRVSNAIEKTDTLKDQFLKLLKVNHNKYKLVSGTRRVVLENFDGGFYGSNSFRQEWHDFFEGKLHKGESIYFEIVGYTDDGKLIMPECDNKKTKDKQFIKQFGDKTRFTYGCGMGQSDIYAYRMTMTNEDGTVVEYPAELVQLRCEQMGVKHVPVLDKFIFTTQEDLVQRVRKYEAGADLIDPTHIREGVIVRIDNKESFAAYKHKNFEFKLLEGIIKESDVLDMEEAAQLEGDAS